MGANGFLGSHVVKELVDAGRDVRVMVRASSNTRAIDHLDIERVIGDIKDRDAIASALAGCDSLFYCIVDTRAWLRDSTPLYQTNVEGLRTVMDLALEYCRDKGLPGVACCVGSCPSLPARIIA